MREKILKDIVTAMKEKEKEKLSVLRMVKGAIQLEELEKKKELDVTEITLLLQKQIKTRKDSIREFEKGARDDLIEKTKKEIKLLEEYMPVQLTSEEIEKEVEKTFVKVKPQSIKDMGKIMKELSNLKGKADMTVVNKIVKEKLESL